MKRSLISEPINIVTGSLGAGKTLFAIQQADLLRRHGDADLVYQVGIKNPDLRKLPALPFPLAEWHRRADAGELKNAVIIVDEFHKWFPQRGQGSRPPEFIEAMAETRMRDVRWILLTQSGEFDHFLKGTRLNRHFYLSRKSGLSRSTIYEWQNRFVSNPEDNKDARAAAVKHLGWRHPVKEYGDWYESAAAHRFRIRLPLRALLAIAFIPVAGYLVWRGVSGFSDVVDSTIGGAAPSANTAPAGQGVSSSPGQQRSQGERAVIENVEDYVKRFNPLHPTLRMSAPAFQHREVAADPQLFCSRAGAGLDAAGQWRDESCSCFTEQMTRVKVDLFDCHTIVRDGLYNPFKPPVIAYGHGGEPGGKAALPPRPAADMPPPASSPSGGPAGVVGAPGHVLPAYGDFRP